jgi:hypothetical protein
MDINIVLGADMNLSVSNKTCDKWKIVNFDDKVIEGPILNLGKT